MGLLEKIKKIKREDIPGGKYLFINRLENGVWTGKGRISLEGRDKYLVDVILNIEEGFFVKNRYGGIKHVKETNMK